MYPEKLTEFSVLTNYTLDLEAPFLSESLEDFHLKFSSLVLTNIISSTSTSGTTGILKFGIPVLGCYAAVENCLVYEDDFCGFDDDGF